MKSRQHHEKALQLYKIAGDRRGIAATLGKIGSLFERKQEPDSAFYYQRHALAVLKTVKDPGKALYITNT